MYSLREITSLVLIECDSKCYMTQIKLLIYILHLMNRKINYSKSFLLAIFYKIIQPNDRFTNTFIYFCSLKLGDYFI